MIAVFFLDRLDFVYVRIRVYSIDQISSSVARKASCKFILAKLLILLPG